MTKKIKYKFNPYTFARISAMKSLLLQKEDYDRIMKMDPSEIIKFLQDGVYREEINELAVKYSGVKLVENALNKHLARIFLKLRIISDPNIQLLMDQYLKRYDFWNLKTLLRAKLSNEKEEELNDILIPGGSLKIDFLIKLYSKDVRQIIESIPIIKASDYREAIEKYENTKDLSEIENLLDYHYYLDSVEFAEKIPEQGKLFKEFFKYEFDIYNLKLTLKKIFFKLDKDYVKKYLIYEGKALNTRLIKALLETKTLESFKREISKTIYRKIFIEEKDETENTLLHYEVLLERFLLQKSILLFHQHLLTVDVVLGYMFAKEIETKNLRTIVKSKKLEFTEDYVKKLIVVR